MHTMTKTMSNWIKSVQLIFSISGLMSLGASAHAEIIFSAAPFGDSQEAVQTFTPLVKFLEEIIGESVVYKHPLSWSDYAQNMREGKYDIVFDAPHFGSWRIKNIDHTPIVRLPGKLGYVILTKKNKKGLNTLRDLLGVKICALASPTLGTMTVYKLFPNPVFMPQIREISGDFRDVYKELKDGKCEAAVLQDVTYNHLIPAEKREVKIITKSAQMPQMTLTIGPRLLAKKKLIAQELMTSKGTRAAAKLFSHNGMQTKSFVNVEMSEYKNLDNLLTDVAWGW